MYFSASCSGKFTFELREPLDIQTYRTNIYFLVFFCTFHYQSFIDCSEKFSCGSCSSHMEEELISPSSLFDCPDAEQFYVSESFRAMLLHNVVLSLVGILLNVLFAANYYNNTLLPSTIKVSKEGGALDTTDLHIESLLPWKKVNRKPFGFCNRDAPPQRSVSQSSAEA